MARIAAAAYASDQVFIIAHPLSAGDPGCTGCAWRFGEMMPGNARLVEIWNGPWRGDSHNEATLALWYDWLNQGLRLAATAGSDTHSRHSYAARPGFNVIYAESLTEPALLSGLRAGRLYLSAGPQLAFEAEDGRGAHWMHRRHRGAARHVHGALVRLPGRRADPVDRQRPAPSSIASRRKGRIRVVNNAG